MSRFVEECARDVDRFLSFEVLPSRPEIERKEQLDTARYTKLCAKTSDTERRAAQPRSLTGVSSAADAPGHLIHSEPYPGR